MTYRCPQGHDSTTDDFCDVCGDPITPPASSPVPATPVSSLALPDPAATPLVCPNCQAENLADALFCEDCGYDFATGQLPGPAPVPGSAAVASVTPISDWVAELWIDPDWHAAQQAVGGCPTSGAPTVIGLTGPTVLIGRHSKSQGLAPDIDCSSDGAVSHRHAQLTLDHGNWSIEDLGSTNGTFVGALTDALPTTPLAPHARHELDADDRVYLGAWCRIMVRKATDAEKTVS